MERPAPGRLRRVHMASSFENPNQPRPPILFVSCLLLLGTLFAWWGTRDYRRLFAQEMREPVAAADVVFFPSTAQEGAGLDRGSQISQRQCAGCHDMASRSIAPSYREIVTFYRRG